ncbi:type VI secretion system baseplate subunit TssE [Pseudoduganella sp. RAF19]|uniref:type VI secretion system baseplate subunit TssE n=1 Tax=Pseudoduganella sp. RAF19 TaxID=3233052 RepID=UPI003F994C93
MSLFDRLLGDRDVTHLKDAVGRDLEDLLNTRSVLPAHLQCAYPECAASVLNYGLADFAAMCLGSSEDRARICASLRMAVERHEPRLRNVRVRLETRPGTVNRVDFSISAVLQAPGAREPVSFNALLQPSSLHYSIKRGARA